MEPETEVHMNLDRGAWVLRRGRSVLSLSLGHRVEAPPRSSEEGAGVCGSFFSTEGKMVREGMPTKIIAGSGGRSCATTMSERRIELRSQKQKQVFQGQGQVSTNSNNRRLHDSRHEQLHANPVEDKRRLRSRAMSFEILYRLYRALLIW